MVCELNLNKAVLKYTHTHTQLGPKVKKGMQAVLPLMFNASSVRCLLVSYNSQVSSQFPFRRPSCRSLASGQTQQA